GRLVDVLEQVRREIAALARDEQRRELLENEVERDRVRSERGSPVREERARRAGEEVAAREVVAEERDDAIAVDSRHAALLRFRIEVAERRADVEIETRRREALLAQQHHAGRRERGIEPPAAAEPAQLVRHLD